MAYIILIFFALLGVLVGIYLYGDSKIRQIQSGMFFGFSLACLLIMIFGL